MPRRARATGASAAVLPAWPVPFDPATELDWSDPVMSRRLLREHLDQSHDGASRRLPEIDRHVTRLGRLLPPGRLRILDAACGPGLYAVRLAHLGHRVSAVDVGPAVLAHARRLARETGVAARVHVVAADLRAPLPASLGEANHDAVLILYWVLEAFERREQVMLLRRLAAMLRPGGVLIAELRVRPDQPPGRVSQWDSVPFSLASDRRHLLLTDTTWDERRRIHVLREVAVLGPGTLAVQQTTGLLTTLDGARRIVERAGLRLRAAYDGWSRYRATGLSSSLLVVAERADQPQGSRLRRPSRT